jgi:hypothetical protein
MRRREFITLIGGAAAGWPLSARAQRTAIPQIGLLDPGVSGLFAAFQQGMRDLRYIEGQTVSYFTFRLRGGPAAGHGAGRFRGRLQGRLRAAGDDCRLSRA